MSVEEINLGVSIVSGIIAVVTGLASLLGAFRGMRHKLLALALLGLVLAGLLTTFLWHWLRGTAQASAPRQQSMEPLPAHSTVLGRIRLSVAETDGPFAAAAFSGDGRYLAVGGHAGHVDILDLSTGKRVQHLRGSETDVGAMAFSADGRWLLTGDADGGLRRWEVATGREMTRISTDAGAVLFVGFSPDGRQTLSSHWDDTIRVCSLDDGREVRQLRPQHTHGVAAVACSREGGTIATTGQDATVGIWDLPGGQLSRLIDAGAGQRGSVRCMALVRDNRQLLSGSSDGTIRLWETDSGRQVRCFRGHCDEVTHLAVAGEYFLSAGADSTVRLWSLGGETAIACWKIEAGSLLALAFDSSGHHARALAADATLYTWSWPSAGPSTQPAGHEPD